MRFFLTLIFELSLLSKFIATAESHENYGPHHLVESDFRLLGT